MSGLPTPPRPHRPPGVPQPPLSIQLILGLAVITLGLLFLLDNMGVLDAGDFIRLWPIVLVAIGIAQIRSAQTAARITSGLIWILVGSILLGNRLYILPWDLWDFWPLVIVAVGGYIVWRSLARESRSPSTEGAPLVSGIAVMGGFSRRVRGEFRGAELTALMGGCELDLRDATLVDGQAEVNGFALMGGIVLKVPETWQVVCEVVPFMGGIDDKTRRPAESPEGPHPRLILKGFVTMGGVEIKN